MYPLNLSNDDLNIMFSNSQMTSCTSYYIKNFRFFTTFKYANEFSLMRFKNLNGAYHDSLLFNLYFDEGGSYVHNYVGTGKSNDYLTVANTLTENYNTINLVDSTYPAFLGVDLRNELNLCSNEQNRIMMTDSCTYDRYDTMILATAVNQMAIPIANSISPLYILNELYIECWLYAIDLSTSQIPWEINVNNGSSTFSISLSQTVVSLSMVNPSYTYIVPSSYSLTIPNKKWFYIAAGLSKSNCESVISLSFITSSLTNTISLCSTMLSTLTNVIINLSKSYNGYLRYFRIWEDYSNYTYYISNTNNYAIPTYYIYNNSYRSKLVSNIPFNYAGSYIVDSVNFISSDPINSNLKVTNEYNSSIDLSVTQAKSTRFVSTTTSSNTILTHCEGNSSYLTTGTCNVKRKQFLLNL